MAGGSIGTAFVDVAFDPKQIEGQLGGIGGKLTGGFGKLGGLAGAAMVTGVGAALAGGVAVGKYLYDVGAQFDDMADSIRVSTGKTGKALDGLVGDAKKVGTEVPTSFEDAGKAVGFLSQRLDVTGKPLQKMSEQLLEVSRLTGTDLNTNMTAASTALAKFHVPAAQASDTLDKLWRASQAAQVPFADLAGELSKFGVPLQAFGFNLDQSLALLDSLHKAGVNVAPTMAGLTRGFANLAKAGKDPVKGLQDTVAAIKAAKTPAEGAGIAIKLFGARAGPELAKAIQSGALSFDDLVKKIGKGHETILKAGQDTADFSEHWQLFKNRVAVAVAPAAEKMFSAIGQGMERLNKEMPGIQAGLGRELGPQIKALGPAFDSIGNSIKDLMPVWKALGDIVVTNMKVILDSVKAFADILAGVIKVVRGLLTGDWSQAWAGAKQIVDGFLTYFKAIGQQLLAPLNAVLGPIKAAASAIGSAILEGLRAGVAPIVGIVTTAFTAVTSAISTAVGAVRSAATAVGTAISTAITTALNAVKTVFVTAFNGYVSAINGVVSAFGTAARAVGTAISTAVMAVLNALKSLIVSAFNGYVSAIRAVVGAYLAAGAAIGKAIVDGIMRLVNTVSGLVSGALRSAASAASGAAAAIGSAIVSALRSSLGGVYGAVKGGLDRIWSAISAVAGAAAGAAVAIGSGIIGGIVSGLSGLASQVADKISSGVHSAIDSVKHAFGISSPSKVTKEEIGVPLAEGIIEGVVTSEKPMSDAIGKTVVAAVEAGRTAIANSRDTFSSAFGELGNDILKAFDAIQGNLKTPKEKLIEQLDFTRAVQAMKDKIADARAALTAARNEQAALAPAEGESDADFTARSIAVAEKVKAAQKALDDALYEQRRAQLEKQAEQERLALDARIALKRRHLEEQLAAEQTAFATGRVNADKAQQDVLKLMNAYGVDYKKAGAALGSAFVTQLKESLSRSIGDIEDMLRRIRNAIDDVRRANDNLKASAPKPKSAAVAAAAPAAAGVSAAALAGPAGPSLQAGAPSGGTLYGTPSPFAGVTRAIRSARARVDDFELPPTIVRVYIGDQELRGIVRTEVGRADDLTARVLLAGAR